MAGRSVRRSGVSAPRRKLIWAREAGLDVPLPANARATTDLLSSFEAQYGAQLIGCTVMRIRGWWQTVGTGPTLAGIRVRGVETGTTVGVTGGPAQSPHLDWMYFDVSAEGEPGGHYFDVRSKRKFEELQESLIIAWESLDTATPGTINYAVSVLVALP